MELKFLGNGSAFSKTHTNAYFHHNHNLYLIDLSMYHVQKAEKLVTETTQNIFILLTHLHPDHASGIGAFAQWLFWVKNKKPIFVSDVRLRSDIIEYMRATGVAKECFTTISIHSDNNLYVFDSLEIKRKEQDALRKEVSSCLYKIIPTVHVPNLSGKCFGFMLTINGKKILYTGDTSTLDPFANKLYDIDEFYCEMSSIDSGVHLYWEREKKKLLEASQKCKIYLMHIDNESYMRIQTKNTNIDIVEIT